MFEFGVVDVDDEQGVAGGHGDFLVGDDVGGGRVGEGDSVAGAFEPELDFCGVAEGGRRGSWHGGRAGRV